MKRTFIAIKIEPGNQLKLLINKLKAGLSGSRIKWVETANLHITLAFLGDTAERDIILVKQLLQTVCSNHKAFTLEFQNIDLFRSLKNPRVLWLGTARSDMLAELRETISSGLTDRGLYNDTRPFRPHLTLGRPKYIKEISFLEDIIENSGTSIIQTSRVEKVLFFESILSQQGPVYRVLGEYSLS